jgi:predicted HicB family RNase H-like nuclease
VDQTYVDRAVAEVEADLAKRAGRPSLTGQAAHSPHVSFRITPELKARAEQTAKEHGTTVSKLAREAFERFLAS